MLKLRAVSRLIAVRRLPVVTGTLKLPRRAPSIPSLVQECAFNGGLWRQLHTSVSLGGSVIPFNLPDVGEAIMTVIVKEWLVKPGDTVSMGDAICEVQSDKSSATIYCPFDGIVTELMYQVDDIAKKDEPLIMIEVEDEGESPPLPEPPSGPDPVPSGPDPVPATQQVSPTQTTPTTGKLLATPAVRKMADEHNIDLMAVTGSGKDGRVLKEDIVKYLESSKAPPTVTEPPSLTMPPLSPPSVEDRDEPIKGIKLIMVKTMTASGQVPQFGYCDEVDMTKMVHLRARLKEVMSERGVPFSYMPLIIKAVSLSLKEHPVLNAHVNQDCTSIRYKADHNIGVAVDTPQGLIVPNIKQVQNKSIFEIAAELNRIHQLSLKGSISPSDVTHGTFSLSNIGALGGTYSRPLVLVPEVCIGALGKIQDIPRFDDGGNVRRSHVMCVSWSADHRVIDGATVARFSNLMKSLLEEPSTMLIDLK